MKGHFDPYSDPNRTDTHRRVQLYKRSTVDTWSECFILRRAAGLAWLPGRCAHPGSIEEMERTLMTARKPARTPNLDFDAEARANLRKVLSQPHHPTAAQDNLARARHALKEARSTESDAEEK